MTHTAFIPWGIHQQRALSKHTCGQKLGTDVRLHAVHVPTRRGNLNLNLDHPHNNTLRRVKCLEKLSLALWYTMPRWCKTSGSLPLKSSTARSRSLNAPMACPSAARVCPLRFQQSGSSGSAFERKKDKSRVNVEHVNGHITSLVGS